MPTNIVRVGDWQLVGNLGQGGFGEVLHWKNRSTNQEIATKHIKNAEQMSADQQRKLKVRWTQEYNWTRDFQQLPNIVAGVQLGDESQEFINYLNRKHIWQLPVIILEYCNGGDVRKLLQQSQNVNGLVEFEVRAILSCLRHAIDFLHTKCKICHRDLKPDNIVIIRLANGNKIYKLTDFGLARNSPDQTSIQSVVGTRHYYAPEVVDTGKYNIKVDYWSLGIIGYEVATGVLPFIPHQKPFNIHENLRHKKRSCIAITEDFAEPDRFHNHNELPLMHHMSAPWTAQFTKLLAMALDTDYTRRGNSIGATDEVQAAFNSPTIFNAIDNLLEMKVLTLFVAFKYQRLEYVVTPEMSMSMLKASITKDTGLPANVLYLLLPIGHPHRCLNQTTRPIDLYVPEWCDNSEHSRNPPVMVYIYCTLPQCEYSAPDPCITPLIQHCISARDNQQPSWIVDRMVLDMHYMLSKEQQTMQTMLFGFKQYAITLEHEIHVSQQTIKMLEIKKDKCCGAMEHFVALIDAAKKEHKMLNNAEWEDNWLKLSNKCKEIVKLIEKTIGHFESALRSIRDAVKNSSDIYTAFLDADIYKLIEFRKNYIRRRDNLTCPSLYDKVIEFSNRRHSFLHDEKVQFLRDGIHQAQTRFFKIIETLNPAHQSLNDIATQLLQLQLQMLPSASVMSSPRQPSIHELNNHMSQLHFDTSNEQRSASLNAFDSQDTMNSIELAMFTRQLLENDMDTECV